MKQSGALGCVLVNGYVCGYFWVCAFLSEDCQATYKCAETAYLATVRALSVVLAVSHSYQKAAMIFHSSMVFGCALLLGLVRSYRLPNILEVPMLLSSE